jgi:hypothetical protein
MVTRFGLSVLLSGVFLLHAGHAGAGPYSTAVVCMPSSEEASGHIANPSHFWCLFELPPWLEGTSFDLTPRASPNRKRWGADFELRF